MPQSNSLDRFQSPPPLPPAAALIGAHGLSADRRRVTTETSASNGWAARLALLFPDKTPAKEPAALASAPRPPARFRTFG